MLKHDLLVVFEPKDPRILVDGYVPVCSLWPQEGGQLLTVDPAPRRACHANDEPRH